MAVSAYCKMTHAKIERALFHSNAVSVCTKIWMVGQLHIYLDFFRAIFEKKNMVTMEKDRFYINVPQN